MQICTKRKWLQDIIMPTEISILPSSAVTESTTGNTTMESKVYFPDT